MGVGEQHTLGGETVDMRGLGLRVTAHDTYPVVEVIDTDHQHIERRFRRLCSLARLLRLPFGRHFTSR